jgi:D-alanyl-D-alanine carboxypeptidase
MKMRLIFAVPTLLAMMFRAGAATPDSIPDFDDTTVRALTAIAESGRTASSTPGLVVGIWAPGKGRFVRAFGVSDLATNTPMELDDHLRIASNTKTFTATAVLQLVDKGCLGLDDHLSKFIAGIPYGDQITIKELLNMTAGVYDYTNNEALISEYVNNPLLPNFTPEEILQVIEQNQPAFPPGTRAVYTNSNYFLLGLIVEKVTRRPLGQVIQTEILDKLGMTNTSYPTTPVMPQPYSHGYYPINAALPSDVTESNPNFAAGAGAMVSTLGDLRIWVKALATGTLLTPATQELRLETVDLGNGIRYGLGISEIDGFIGHNGAILGYGSAMYYLPSSDATFVLIGTSCNLYTSPPTNIFLGLAYYLFPEQFPNGI